MHGSQKRASGDPYFAHPIEVAGILTDYRLDTATIVTALLHDVIEDTEVTRADIDRLFGEEVGELVEGVTKLSRLEATADHKRQAENLRKFILAVSKDVRVLLVKLADRLHNMRTLHYIANAAKRERIARETLDIYAPLARSIGCHRICSELEELAFSHLNPVARDAILRRLDTLRAGQGKAVLLASSEIEAKLKAAGIDGHVIGREKNPFSIWRKLQRKSIGFSQLSDIYGFRVIVRTEDECYRALGRYPSVLGQRSRAFQGLHLHPQAEQLSVAAHDGGGPRAMRIEMQIRTEAMDRVAEEGVAAHWRYKNQTYAFDPEAAAAAGSADPLADLRQLVQVLDQGGDAEDLLEHAKLEMFLDQVFVFTPKGKLISLPSGAMPLDFAYAVHSDVGDTCIGVKINGELRPSAHAAFERRRHRGGAWEASRRCMPDWQSLTVTARARSAIRRHIRQVEKDEYVRLGRVSLDQTLRARRQNRGPTSRCVRRSIASRPATEAELVRGRGSRARSSRSGARSGVPGAEAGRNGRGRRAAAHRRRQGARFYVRGDGLAAGVGLHFPHCCYPMPGDRIVGIASQPQTLEVHVIDCGRLAAFEDQEDLWKDLHWTAEAEHDTVSEGRLHATIHDGPGVLGQACTVIGEASGNIVGVNMRHRHTNFFDVDFDVEVRDARHLTHIAAALRACPSVETVERARG